MHNKYRRSPARRAGDGRLKRKLATEAARQLLARLNPGQTPSEISADEFAIAKRQAVTLLGQRVREGDLPSDSEVREELIALGAQPVVGEGVPAEASSAMRLADHLDRFTVFKLLLEPLQAIKLHPTRHPEGDALYHVLQVFELARGERPFDEEFLLAALLHHVGQAIDPRDPVAAGLHALDGLITPRTHWLIQTLPEVVPRDTHNAPQRPLRTFQRSEFFDDLELLLEVDVAGREPGARVDSLEEVLDYLRSLDQESGPDQSESNDQLSGA